MNVIREKSDGTHRSRSPLRNLDRNSIISSVKGRIIAGKSDATWKRKTVTFAEDKERVLEGGNKLSQVHDKLLAKENAFLRLVLNSRSKIQGSDVMEAGVPTKSTSILASGDGAGIPTSAQPSGSDDTPKKRKLSNSYDKPELPASALSFASPQRTRSSPARRGADQTTRAPLSSTHSKPSPQRTLREPKSPIRSNHSPLRQKPAIEVLDESAAGAVFDTPPRSGRPPLPPAQPSASGRSTLQEPQPPPAEAAAQPSLEVLMERLHILETTLKRYEERDEGREREKKTSSPRERGEVGGDKKKQEADEEDSPPRRSPKEPEPLLSRAAFAEARRAASGKKIHGCSLHVASCLLLPRPTDIAGYLPHLHIKFL